MKTQEKLNSGKAGVFRRHNHNCHFSFCST